MKNSGQTSATRKWHRVSVSAVHLALLGSLSACTENPFSNLYIPTSDTQSSGDPAANPADHSDAGSNSVGIAQEVAAGTITPTVVQASAIPNLGTALPVISENEPNPLAIIPVIATDSGREPDETTAEPATVENTEAQVTVENNDNNNTDLGTSDITTTDVVGNDTKPPVTEASVDSSDVFAGADETNDTYPGNAVESKSESATFFTSHTTKGFTGEVIDDSIHVTWNKDPEARGYNVYREGKYITTVMENNYVETDLFDQNYYYEIQAFNKTQPDPILYYVATGLTVSVKNAGKTDPARPKANPNLLQDYELIFSDEFNGNSLDTSKWNTSFLWGDELFINGEVQYYVDIKNKPDFGFNPFSFDGEHLTINSIKTPSELSEKALGQPYLSGIITSYDALQFVYGYAETRAKVTFGRGYWPAFWLLNAYYGQGGDDPEIDIMEFIGHDQDVVYHTYHYYDAEGQLRSTESQPTPGIDYTAEFHTFAVDWQPGIIIYLVDGIEVHRVIDPKVSQQSMYVIANTAMGGWWAGNPDEATPFPGEYVIDYIRVYQKTTPYDDVLFSDDLTDVPFADDIPGQAIPNHRPTPQQWPAGYPHRQQ